jgi:uncharacterized phage protein (TIGR01671 family)
LKNKEAKMRTIEFRGITVDTKEMVYGDLIMGVGAKDGKYYILPRILNFAYPETKAKPHHLDGYEIIPTTIGQFTGLYDKNGVKIFEGDRIRIPDYRSGAVIGGKQFERVIEVCYDKLFNGYGYYGMHYEAETIEVIGNIHEGGDNE